jgi:hypothetical protein
VIFSKSFLQTTVAVSSCEAELNGIFEAALWLEFFRQIASFMGIAQPHPTPTFVDSTAAMAVLKKRVPSGRSKHYDVRYFRINQSIDNGEISLHWLQSELMPADIGTKPLPRPRFLELAAPILSGQLTGVYAPSRSKVDPAPSRRCVDKFKLSNFSHIPDSLANRRIPETRLRTAVHDRDSDQESG